MDTVLTKQHIARFNAAVKLFTRLKDAASKPGALLMEDGCLLEASAIQIEQDKITVQFCENGCTVWFDLDPSWDHGCHTTIAEYAADVRKRFKVVKQVKW